MNLTSSSQSGRRFGRLLTAALLGAIVFVSANSGRAQNPPSRLVVFADVVKLAQAHQSDDVIVSYIRSTGGTFSLTADEIIYLSNQGVSQSVISALQSKDVGAPPAIPSAPVTSPLPVAPPATPPPPGGPGGPVAPEAPEVTYDYFHNKLTADGVWMDLPGYGSCWRPAVAVANPEWRPYYDHGHWVYTDNGWFWQSDDPWGEIVFHYGRWHQHPVFGWIWVPAYDWAPAWVSWRHSEGYLGWAPLPPEARFTVGVGLMFNGRVAVDVDFGLTEAHYNFIGYDHFWEHDYYRYRVPRERIVILYRDSRLSNTYRIEGHRFVNEGFGREHVELVTHHTIIVERPVIRDPIVARHVEKTVVIVKTEPHPMGHPAGESKPVGGATGTASSGKPATTTPTSTSGTTTANHGTTPSTGSTTGSGTATTPSSTTGNRGNTYSSGGQGSQPHTSQSKTNSGGSKPVKR